MSATRRGWLVIAEICILTFLFALSLEVACRIEDWVQFRTPFFALERSQEDLLIRDELGMHGRPGGHFQKWSLNSFGMRGPDVSSTKPAGSIRVVTAGASETFGLYESPGREYPRQLEDTLNARLGVAGITCSPSRVQVLNAAMPGMSLPTIEQDIRLRVRSLKPDFVVLYATPAGYLYDNAPAAAAPDSSSHDSQLPLANAILPRAADRLRIKLKELLPNVVQDMIRRRQISAMVSRHPPGWRFDSVPVERVAAYRLDLARAVATIQSVGATPVLVTHANRFVGSDLSDRATLRMWEKFYPRAPGETIVAFDSAARVATIAVAQASNAVLVDLAPTIARSRVAAFADYAHFTDFGAGVTAGTVAGSVLRALRSAVNAGGCR